MQESKKPVALGVLFVHGIGDQKQGQTLRRCGDAIVTWLSHWSTRSTKRSVLGGPVVVTDAVERPGAAEPARCRVRCDALGVDWTLSEAWWGQAAEPPPTGVIARWALGFGFRTLRRVSYRQQGLAHETYRRDREAEVPLGVALQWPLVAGVAHTLRVLLIFVATVVSMTLLGIGVALAFIPAAAFPPLRSAFTRAALVLSNTVGDTYLLRSSPVSFAAMADAVHNGLDWLEANEHSRIAVVAHSQGAAIAYRALTERPRSSVELFVTYGSALRLLVSERPDDEAEEEAVDRVLTSPTDSAGLPIPWLDYYALCDPVADGSQWRVVAPKHAHSTPVHNRSSFVRDHNSYWTNTDEFVAWLVIRLSGASSPDGALTDSFGDDLSMIRRASNRRSGRVKALVPARANAGSAFVSTALILYADGLGRFGSMLRNLASDVGTATGLYEVAPVDEHSLVGLAGVTLAFAAAYALTVLIWNGWDRAAIAAMFRRQAEPPLTRWRAAFVTAGMLPLPIPPIAIVLAWSSEDWTPWLVVAGVFALTLAIVFPSLIVDSWRGPVPSVPNAPTDDPAVGSRFMYREGWFSTKQPRKVEIVRTTPNVLGSSAVVRFLDDSPGRGYAKCGELKDVPVGPDLRWSWGEYEEHLRWDEEGGPSAAETATLHNLVARPDAFSG